MLLRGHNPPQEVRDMLRRMLPLVIAAIAISVAFSLLFATQRMNLPHPSLDKLTKRFSAEPELPDPESEGI